MEYQIKKMSYYARNLLESFTTGTIHSVYRRTINLTDGRRILSLQTDGSPLSPVSLISSLTPEEMEKLSVSPGDSVYFGKSCPDGLCPDKECFILQGAGQPRLHSCLFSYKNARQYNLELSRSIDASLRPALASSLHTALSLTKNNGFALLFGAEADKDSSLSLIHTAAGNYMNRSRKLCLDRRYSEAAAELTRLLGLGTGLTPSGDDFLCGVLAGLSISGVSDHPFARHLRDAVISRLTDTIDISAAFLSCALENQYSLPVCSLCSLPSPKEILTSFEAVGHSSGTDTLCGILWGLEYNW